jgi:molybdopterin-guanine dinucleotide biosynthesis protein B
MRTIHIVGRKNHGKTTLVLELLAEFGKRGLHVGTVKHSSHVHELDTPGKDSHGHRLAGADPVAVVTSELVAVFQPRRGDFYEQLAPLYAQCDLVLVEGHIDGPGIKLEVWRESIGGACLADVHADIVAVISDDQPKVSVPLLPRCDIPAIAEKILALRSS